MKKNLSAFLQKLQDRLPYELLRVERAVSPGDFEATAFLQHLENERRFPAVLFEKPAGRFYSAAGC